MYLICVHAMVATAANGNSISIYSKKHASNISYHTISTSERCMIHARLVTYESEKTSYMCSIVTC
jgi:hypothetical protein